MTCHKGIEDARYQRCECVVEPLVAGIKRAVTLHQPGGVLRVERADQGRLHTTQQSAMRLAKQEGNA